jgi:hypothetical protein
VSLVEISFVRAFVEYVPDDALDGTMVKFVTSHVVDFGSGVGGGGSRHILGLVRVG